MKRQPPAVIKTGGWPSFVCGMCGAPIFERIRDGRRNRTTKGPRFVDQTGYAHRCAGAAVPKE